MDGEVTVSYRDGSQRSLGHPDRGIGALADRQHGVVARSQLLRLGLSGREIQGRLTNGRLRPLHRGVYAVGHSVVSREGRLLAAVLAAGPGAVLSHRSAASLWSIRASARERVEVTAPRRIRPQPGIQPRRSTLRTDEHTVLEAIPITTPARTLLDLASVLDGRRLERAVNEAEVQRIFDGRALAAILARYPRRAGAPTLRAVLADLDPGPPVLRSELEHRFCELLDDHGLPDAEMNPVVEVSGARYEPDAVWRAQRLIAELDGWATHGTRRRFELDRERDLRLQLAGWRVVRFTWRQLRDRPAEVAGGLSALLARTARP